MFVDYAFWYAIAGKHGTKAADGPASRGLIMKVRAVLRTGSIIDMWEEEPLGILGAGSCNGRSPSSAFPSGFRVLAPGWLAGEHSAGGGARGVLDRRGG
jgi:hypothetical protein